MTTVPRAYDTTRNETAALSAPGEAGAYPCNVEVAGGKIGGVTHTIQHAILTGLSGGGLCPVRETRRYLASNRAL